jgi:hypothetical protein
MGGWRCSAGCRVVTRACNTRFLRLVEGAIPRLAAQMDRCPPKADVKGFWITKEIEITKKLNAFRYVPLRGLENLA